MWASTPHGVLKAAAGTSGRAIEGGTELTFTLGGRHGVVARINKMNQVERLSALVPNDVMGDMPYVVTYAGYRSMNGVMFPSRITVTQGGHPTPSLTSTSPTAACRSPGRIVTEGG